MLYEEFNLYKNFAGIDVLNKDDIELNNEFYGNKK